MIMIIYIFLIYRSVPFKAAVFFRVSGSEISILPGFFNYSRAPRNYTSSVPVVTKEGKKTYRKIFAIVLVWTIIDLEHL